MYQPQAEGDFLEDPPPPLFTYLSLAYQYHFLVNELKSAELIIATLPGYFKKTNHHITTISVLR